MNADNVTVRDTIPAMTSYVGCSTPQGSCGPSGAEVVFNVGTVTPMQMVVMTFDTLVDPPPLPPGQICNDVYSVAIGTATPVFGTPGICVDLVPVELMEFESRSGK